MKTQTLSIEDQFLLDILSSENNNMSYQELNLLSFRELNDYKTLIDLLSRSKLATQLDNQPKGN